MHRRCPLVLLLTTLVAAVVHAEERYGPGVTDKKSDWEPIEPAPCARHPSVEECRVRGSNRHALIDLALA